MMALAAAAVRRFPCPACRELVLEEPAWFSKDSASDEICPSCGIQFGYDDAEPDLRAMIHGLWGDRWRQNGRLPLRPRPSLDELLAG